MKRIFDYCVSIILVMYLFPVLLAMAMIIRNKLGRPVIFKQIRPGLGGKPFELCKFRSMTDGRDKNGYLLPDSQRMTSFGRYLRQSSLDELPELWNVLKGDMSLVGPRPLLMQYLERYLPEQARRHEVKPGITGWAQVNGRNSISWEKKFELDVWYVDNKNFVLDIKILFLTLISILKKEGINQKGQVTVEEFRGRRV